MSLKEIRKEMKDRGLLVDPKKCAVARCGGGNVAAYVIAGDQIRLCEGHAYAAARARGVSIESISVRRGEIT